MSPFNERTHYEDKPGSDTCPGVIELKTPQLELSVEFVGGKLKAVIPGQPVATLAPGSPDRFTVEGAPAPVFVQFKLAEAK